MKDFLARRRPEAPIRLERGVVANDSRYFPQFGKPMVSIGEIVSAGSHSDDEWIDLDTLNPQIDFMCDYLLGAN